MAEITAQALNARYVRALNDHDWVAMADILHPDFVTDWPQSGERVVGLDNLRRILDGYPGTSQGNMAAAMEGSARVFAAGERWIVTPMFTTIRVSGTADRYTSVARARYPNGEVWYVIALVEVRDDLMYHSTTFFAPIYPAPEWRAAFVEPLAEDDGADQ
jgi:hypothetical protein